MKHAHLRRMEYLKLNMTDDQFIDRLKKSIEHDHPFSFSRFGDGEIFFINDNVPQKVIDRYLRSIYGYDDIDKAKSDVLSVINKALAESDVIGIMNKDNPISRKISYSEKAWSIRSDYVSRMRGEKELLVADHMITRSRDLGDVHNFRNIIQGRGVCIISPHVDLHKQRDVQGLLGVDMSFVKTPMGISMKDRDELFLIFDKIQEPIVLYGCTLMGKDFSVHLKDRGKIALDFGATLDAWAGLMTKRWFFPGKSQNHCVI